MVHSTRISRTRTSDFPLTTCLPIFIRRANFTISSALCRLPAACIVSPRSAEEVATALKIVVKYRTKFAIRSGGRNYIPGFASINETGVLISLSELNSIILSEDKTAVRVGPGNRWDVVYKALAPEGLTVVGGRVGPVGVGGLVLGGNQVLPCQLGVSPEANNRHKVV
jgi:FAD/FMN-containing dehydrogenase